MPQPQVNACENRFRLLGGLAVMGKTVPSSRMALEEEIKKMVEIRE